MSDYTPESRLAGQFGRARRVIEDALRTVSSGSKRMTRADLALQRAYDHAQDQTPALHVWESGGSSVPNDDRAEEVRTKRQAAKDHPRLIFIGKELDRLAREAEQIINRQAEVVHESKLPTGGPLEGCRSCNRFDHKDEVDPKRPAFGLCRYCRDFEINYGQLPPKEALDLRHGESPRAAGLWVARSPELKAAAAKVDADRLAAKLAPLDELPACPNTWTDMERGVVHPCLRPQGHPPGCRGSYQGQSIAFPGVMSA